MRSAIVMLGIAVASSFSCSYFTKKPPGVPPVIRYMNLKAVYNFILNKNRDAVEVKKKLDEKMTRLKEVERELEDPATDHTALLDEYRGLTADLSGLRTKSKYYKSRILNEIDRAVKNVAKTMKADFVYNIGEELIYAKKEYDITEDILQEVLRLEERKAPESR